MDTPITRAEHEEFKKRLEDENKRLSRRIDDLKSTLDKYIDLAVSVNSLANSLKALTDEVGKQNDRIDELENKPAENWNAIIRSILTGIGSAIAVAVVAMIAASVIK